MQDTRGFQRARRAAGAAILSGLLLFLAACGGDSGPAGDTAGGVVSADPNTVVVQGVPPLAELYKGTMTAPPTSSPPAARGKKVWWVTCGSTATVCLMPGEAAREAGAKLGIDVTIVDGKFNAGGEWGNAIRSAIAADADAIMMYGISCPAIQQPLEEARQAGVLVMGVAGDDCSDTGDGPTLYTAPLIYSDTVKTGYQYFYEMGKLSAQYIINRTNGQAKVLYTAGTFAEQVAGDKGFRDEFAKCTTCEIVDTLTYDTQDLVPNGPWIQGFRNALLRNPDANAVYFEWDVMSVALGGLQAVEESGLQNVITFGAEGIPESFDFVRNGRLTAITKVHSSGWLGYAAMDDMNRYFNGQTGVPQGLGFTVTDAENNLPAGQGTVFEGEGKVDWKAAYEANWAQAG